MALIPPPQHQTAAKAIAVFAKLVCVQCSSAFPVLSETVGWLEQELDRHLRHVLVHGGNVEPAAHASKSGGKSPVALLLQCVPSWQEKEPAHPTWSNVSDVDLLVFLTTSLMAPSKPQPQRGLAAHLLPASVLTSMFSQWRRAGKRAARCSQPQTDGNVSCAHAQFLSTIGGVGTQWLATYLRRLKPIEAAMSTTNARLCTIPSEGRLLPPHVKGAFGLWRSQSGGPLGGIVPGGASSGATARARAEKALDILSHDVGAAEFLTVFDSVSQSGTLGAATSRAGATTGTPAVPQQPTRPSSAQVVVGGGSRGGRSNGKIAVRGVATSRGGRARGAGKGGVKRRRRDDSDVSDSSSTDESSDESESTTTDASSESDDGASVDTASSNDPIQAIVRRHAQTAHRTAVRGASNRRRTTTRR